MTRHLKLNRVRNAGALALAMGLAAGGNAAFAAGVVQYTGYDDSNFFTLSGSTYTPTTTYAATDFDNQAPASTQGSSLWAEQQFKSAPNNVFSTYNFVSSPSSSINTAESGQTIVSPGVSIAVGSGWTMANLTDLWNNNPVNNGEPIQGATGNGPALSAYPPISNSSYYTGSNNTFLQLQPSSSTATDTVTLTFAKPVDAVGLFIYGLGNAAGSINFNVNSTTLFSAKGSEDTNTATATTGANTASAHGGVAYYGFTDATPFTTLTLNETSTGDEFGIEQIDYGSVAPEPSTVASFLVAGALLGSLLVRKRRGAAHSA